jgi:hypothetical protein
MWKERGGHEEDVGVKGRLEWVGGEEKEGTGRMGRVRKKGRGVRRRGKGRGWKREMEPLGGRGESERRKERRDRGCDGIGEENVEMEKGQKWKGREEVEGDCEREAEKRWNGIWWKGRGGQSERKWFWGKGKKK